MDAAREAQLLATIANLAATVERLTRPSTFTPGGGGGGSITYTAGGGGGGGGGPGNAGGVREPRVQSPTGGSGGTTASPPA